MIKSKFRQVFIGFNEVVRIIEDLENGAVEPTSARLGTEDVALDMDDIRSTVRNFKFNEFSPKSHVIYRVLD